MEGFISYLFSTGQVLLGFKMIVTFIVVPLFAGIVALSVGIIGYQVARRLFRKL